MPSVFSALRAGIVSCCAALGHAGVAGLFFSSGSESWRVLMYQLCFGFGMVGLLDLGCQPTALASARRRAMMATLSVRFTQVCPPAERGWRTGAPGRCTGGAMAEAFGFYADNILTKDHFEACMRVLRSRMRSSRVASRSWSAPLPAHLMLAGFGCTAVAGMADVSDGPLLREPNALYRGAFFADRGYNRKASPRKFLGEGLEPVSSRHRHLWRYVR